MIFTIVLIAITALVSLAAFNDQNLLGKLILWPRVMDNKPGEYYRFLTSGFIHGDLNHLLFNMFTLYSFGRVAEYYAGGWVFLILYLTGIVISDIPTYIKNRNNGSYRALGASGGVSSVLFFCIYYSPWSKIGIMFIPVGIPGIIFGALYVAYCTYMSKRGGDNINHDAHLWGSVYGLLFALIMDPTHGQYFLNTIMHPM